MKRSCCTIVLLFTVLAVLPPGAARAEAADGPRNIVFILADDLGWADLGCYGNRFNETPNLDKLAAQGMRFTDAYAACPVCSPTRASIISGQYPARVGITDFIPGHWRPYEKVRVPVNRTQYLPLEAVSLAEALAPAGYRAGMFGKWHLGGPKYDALQQGFADVMETSGWGHFFPTVKARPPRDVPDGAYLADVLTDRAEEFLAAHRATPFFLYLSHFAVHIPLEAREELVARYRAKPAPETGVNNPVYAAMVEHVDRSVGRVLARLEALGLADRTMVVFFSDNGGLYRRFDGEGEIVTSNAPLRGEKGTLYEGGIREPLIIRLPGVTKPGSVCRAPVTSVDFYPTFLELAGAPKPADWPLDGASLMPLLAGGGLARDAIFWHYPHYHHATPAGAVRMGDWKLLEDYEDGHLELYNLAEDIGETRNLAAGEKARAARMQARLAAWRKDVGAELPAPNPDFDPARRGTWGKHPGR